MRVVKPVGGNFDGQVRCGKRLIAVEQKDGNWEADVEGDELVVLMNAGFVKPDSPMAKPAKKRAAPVPAVDVVVVEKKEKKPAPKKTTKKSTSKKSAPKKSK